MNKKLQSIAQQLTESDIQELIRLKKQGSKKTIALRKKRDKLAAELARIDAQLEKADGDAGADAAKPARTGRRGRRKAAVAKPAKAPAKAKKAGARKGGRRQNLSAAVREVFAQAGTPLKASQVVDGLPTAGVKVKNVADMRKRISVVLASQKNHFEQVERGVYQLKSE